jgi:GTP pyrophosphokinase
MGDVSRVEHVPSPRFVEAVALAVEVHGHQERKGLGVTYLAHVLAVSATVWEYGGDEDLAIAGLLHDAVEDGGGAAMGDRIAGVFGDRVAAVVLECSDSIADAGAAKAQWFARKVRHLAKMADRSDDALLVAAADKFHNVRSLIADHRAVGDDLWSRFNAAAGPAGTVWYYRRLEETIVPRLVLAGGRRAQLGSELTRAVEEFASAVRRSVPDLDGQVRRRRIDAQAFG